MSSFDDIFKSGEVRPNVPYKYALEDRYPGFLNLAIGIKSALAPAKVLDLGCAKGFLVKAFRDIGIEAYGIDGSEEAISQAPKEVRNYLLRLDLNSQPFPFTDASFDLITALSTLEYLDSHEDILNEVRRLLKNGGGLFIHTTTRKPPDEVMWRKVGDRHYWEKECLSRGLKLDEKAKKAILLARADAAIKSELETAKSLKYGLVKSVYPYFPGVFQRYSVWRANRFDSKRHFIKLFFRKLG